VFALYLKTKNFHWHMSGRQALPGLSGDASGAGRRDIRDDGCDR
jgi:hypothetical protein